MVIIMKRGATQAAMDEISKIVQEAGCQVSPAPGEHQCVIGIVGDVGKVRAEAISMHPEVERIMRVAEPFKQANRKFHPTDTVVSVGDKTIGGKNLAVIAGPCSVETEEQIVGIARAVKAKGASFLRGGAFKPRTSPYSFQGLGLEGLELLKIAKEETGLQIVSEIMSTNYLDAFVNDVDVIQVGARNMQNFELLKELGTIRKPILLKRGLANTLEEWVMSAEYIMSGGNHDVILCERGIRTFETYTRNTLDLSAVLALKQMSHLPVLVDPSHAAGLSWMVPALSKGAVAMGADGLIIEVHHDPRNAWCDGAQSITPDTFGDLMDELKPLAELGGRTLA